MTIHLREYRADDFDFVRALFLHYLEEERTRVPVLGMKEGFVEAYLPSLVEKTRDEHGVFLVAELDGVRTGFAAALPKEPQPWDQTHGKVVMLMELHVHPNGRRQGVGRALVDAVERRFAREGYDWVTLGTMARNAEAHAVYRAMGFETTYQFMGRRLARPE